VRVTLRDCRCDSREIRKLEEFVGDVFGLSLTHEAPVGCALWRVLVLSDLLDLSRAPYLLVVPSYCVAPRTEPLIRGL